MNKTKSEEPLVPIRLTTGAIIDGQYFSPGADTPYMSEIEVPLNLRELIARNEEDIPPPVVRNIYGQQPGVSEPVIYQATGGAQWVQRQAIAGLEEQAACEAQAETDQQLPAETQEALEDQQTGRIEKARAQMKYNQDIVEASYEAAAQEAESRTLVFHVKRGAVFTRCEKTKCKVGEPCFVKDESGEWAFAGVVDSTGSPPSQPIIT